MAIEIKTFYDDRTNTLTFVVYDRTTRDAVAIDPVLDYDPESGRTWTESVDRIAAFIAGSEIKLHYVLETHAHADHLSGSQILRRRFGAKVAIGDRIREVQETFQHVFDLPELRTDGSQFDRLLADGEVVRAGSIAVEVIATPGHTPACLTYKIGDAVFTGDALFMDDYGTGRCDFPRGSADAMYESIQKLYKLPNLTRVYPGHDYQPNGRGVRWVTTIGESKDHNPQLSAKTTKAEFVAARQARDKALAPPRLLYPSVQINIDAGRMPKPHANGTRYLVVPLRPTDDAGVPVSQS